MEERSWKHFVCFSYHSKYQDPPGSSQAICLAPSFSYCNHSVVAMECSPFHSVVVTPFGYRILGLWVNPGKPGLGHFHLGILLFLVIPSQQGHCIDASRPNHLSCSCCCSKISFLPHSQTQFFLIGDATFTSCFSTQRFIE